MVTEMPAAVGVDDDGLEPIQGFCQCSHSMFNHDRLSIDRNGIEKLVCALCNCKGFVERDPSRLGLMLVS